MKCVETFGIFNLKSHVCKIHRYRFQWGWLWKFCDKIYNWMSSVIEYRDEADILEMSLCSVSLGIGCQYWEAALKLMQIIYDSNRNNWHRWSDWSFKTAQGRKKASVSSLTINLQWVKVPWKSSFFNKVVDLFSFWHNMVKSMNCEDHMHILKVRNTFWNIIF